MNAVFFVIAISLFARIAGGWISVPCAAGVRPGVSLICGLMPCSVLIYRDVGLTELGAPGNNSASPVLWGVTLPRSLTDATKLRQLWLLLL